MSKRLATWAETDSASKRQKSVSDPDEGRPTQVHAVPLHERAVDSQGRVLPWGLEWHEYITLLSIAAMEPADLHLGIIQMRVVKGATRTRKALLENPKGE